MLLLCYIKFLTFFLTLQKFEMHSKLEKATGQVLPSAKYRPTRLVVDAALRRIGKTRHGVTKLQISPVFVNVFKNGCHQWIQRIFLVVVEGKIFFRKFCCFQNLDALYRPVAGKPLVLEYLCLGMGTSVASAVTAETIFEINVCLMSICVAACAWGQNLKFSGFSNLSTPTIEIFRFLDVGHPE